jgi:hypothetical protein
LGADECKAFHPIDDGLRTRRLLDPQSEGQETQDARDGAKTEARD